MPHISEAESRVMQVLWEQAPLGSDAIVAALAARTDWQPKTIRTLLNRLLRKGAVKARREGRRYLYSPVLLRDAWQATESRDLLDRAFGGRLTPMLAHFTQHEKLTAQDVRELRELVDAIEREHGAGKGRR